MPRPSKPSKPRASIGSDATSITRRLVVELDGDRYSIEVAPSSDADEARRA
jgi:hypothetical protein